MKPFGATKQDWGRSDEPSAVKLNRDKCSRKSKKDTCSNLRWERSIKKRARQEAKKEIEEQLFQASEDYRLTLQELLFLEGLD